MSERELQKQISALAAKVTALTMLMEALWVDELGKQEDPAKFAKAFTDDVFQKEAMALEKHGESEVSLQLSEALISLMDRAVSRAIAQRSKKRPK
jgi:hypothetical protein